MGEYGRSLAALDAGTLGDADKVRTAAVLARLTGLPAADWLARGLRMSPDSFLKSLLAEQGLEAGVYDSRYTLPLAASLGDPVADDPAMTRYVPGFISAFHQLLHDDLGVEMPIPYRAITWVTLNSEWSRERVGAIRPRPIRNCRGCANRQRQAPSTSHDAPPL